MSYPASSRLLRQPVPQVRLDKVQRNFERRKVALGTCGRAFGSTCVHEHACAVPCSGRTQPSGPAYWRSAATCSAASPKPSAKAGSARSRD